MSYYSGIQGAVNNTLDGCMYVVREEERTDLWNPRYQSSYQYRHINNNFEQYGFFAGWPASKAMSGDGSSNLVLGADAQQMSGLFEPWSLVDGGNYRPFYIHGVCRDGSAVPLGGAILTFFITSTKALVGTCQTDTNGIYSMPTVNFGIAHFAYANYGPDTLLGGTVDTLIPVSSPW